MCTSSFLWTLNRRKFSISLFWPMFNLTTFLSQYDNSVLSTREWSFYLPFFLFWTELTVCVCLQWTHAKVWVYACPFIANLTFCSPLTFNLSPVTPNGITLVHSTLAEPTAGWISETFDPVSITNFLVWRLSFTRKNWKICGPLCRTL
jgi:hypothetical protein